MSTHTPGPWKVIASPHGRKYRCVQLGTDEGYTTLELEPADARLIAAAPDMFLVLQRVVMDGLPIEPETLKEITRAIAKASTGAE